MGFCITLSVIKMFFFFFLYRLTCNSKSYILCVLYFCQWHNWCFIFQVHILINSLFMCAPLCASMVGLLHQTLEGHFVQVSVYTNSAGFRRNLLLMDAPDGQSCLGCVTFGGPPSPPSSKTPISHVHLLLSLIYIVTCFESPSARQTCMLETD